MVLDITFVSTHLGHVRGGGEVNDLNLGEALEELGHNVTYITIHDSSKEFLSLNAKCRPIHCPYWYGFSYDLPEPLGKVVRHLNEELFIFRVKRQEGTFLQEQNLVLATGRPILSRLTKATDGLLFYAARGRVNPLYDRYLHRADAIVFWGGCEQEYEREDLHAHPNVTLNPAIDSNLFHPLLSEEHAPMDATGRITVGFVGRLEEVKRVDRIIDAVAVISETYPLKLIIVGDGSRRKELQRHAQQKLDEDAFEFVGRVPRTEVPRYLNAIDIFVMASRLENHPIALKEALACGTFCVAPDVGRVREILPERSGEVYTPNTVTGLRNCLKTILDEERFYDKTNKQRAENFTTWTENAQSILALYDSLITSERATSTETT